MFLKAFNLFAKYWDLRNENICDTLPSNIQSKFMVYACDI